MASNKPDASAISSTIEELKASRRTIHSQHANLGLELSSLDARISTLESQLREYVERESEVMPTSDTIDLNVKNLFGKVSCFTMKRCTRMEKLMKAYCGSEGLRYEDVRYIFKGRQLGADQSHQTPEQLGMEDGDEIHAVLRLIGS